MEHMKEALRRKMHSMKGPHAHEEGSPEEEKGESLMDEEKEEDSDLAPNLEHAPHDLHPKMEMGDADHDPMGGAQAGEKMLGEGSPEHIAILKGLSDSGHLGRGGMSLHERAGDKAKEKMASIMAAHKGGKRV